MSPNNPTKQPKQPKQPPHEQEQPSVRLLTEVVNSKTPSREQQNPPSEQPKQLFSYGGYREIREGSNIPKPPNTDTPTRACTCSFVPEHTTEATLRSATKTRGGLCWKFTSPGTDGVPDRIIILPGGKIGFVELKTTGAKPRLLQTHRLNQLTNLGVPAFVIDHPNQIKKVLDAIQAA